jgi:hypothetical protein
VANLAGAGFNAASLAEASRWGWDNGQLDFMRVFAAADGRFLSFPLYCLSMLFGHKLFTSMFGRLVLGEISCGWLKNSNSALSFLALEVIKR